MCHLSCTDVYDEWYVGTSYSNRTNTSVGTLVAANLRETRRYWNHEISEKPVYISSLVLRSCIRVVLGNRTNTLLWDLEANTHRLAQTTRFVASSDRQACRNALDGLLSTQNCFCHRDEFVDLLLLPDERR